MEFYNNFISNLISYLLKNTEDIKKSNKISNLIRKNKTNLLKLGDLTVSLDEQILQYHNVEIDENLNSKLKNIVDKSKNWTIKLNKVNLVNKNNINVCNLYINRKSFFEVYLKVFNQENYGKVVLFTRPNIYNICIENDSPELENLSVTQYRIVLIKTILQNLLQYICYEKNFEPPLYKNILVTQKTPSQHNNDSVILCGCVYDPRNGKKMAKLQANQYITQRSIDMQLMAQHKYGLRVKNEKVFIDLINKLGSAAAIVDLIETKHSNAVGIVNSNRQSSSKGASFILYNSARLEAIFRIFEERVAEGYYPPLPPFEQIDLSLLKEEEEWEIFYSFIFEFPNLIQRAVGNLGTGDVSPHIICSYLNSLVGLFSVYYRRVKILTENRQQLLPLMYARLFLLHCLRHIFNKVLRILSIEPVTQM